MLKIFRDNIKYLSWILWVVIALFVLFVFVDFGGSIRNRDAAGGRNMAAKVGNRTVTMADYQRQYQQMEQMYGQIYGGGRLTPEMAKQLQLPLQALNRAVNEQVLLAEAERLGLHVSDDELRDMILQQPSFVDEQGRFIGEDKYAQRLAAAQYTVASFETEVRNELLRNKLMDALRNGIYIGDDEIEKSYRDQVEKVKVRYVQLPRAQLADVQPTPAEVSTYFEAHKADLKLPEQREGAYLLVEPDRLRDQVNLTDKEMKDYYDQHQDEFKRPEQVQARHILIKVDDKRPDAQAKQEIEKIKQRIAGGADFAKVAGEVSEDPGSKVKGGDLGRFGRGQMVKEFEDAAFNAKAGELVGPVKSPFGYHLIQVLDKQPGSVVSFDEAKNQIRARLSFTRVADLAQQKAKALATRIAKDKPKTTEALAALAKSEPGVTFTETGNFAAQDPLPGLGRAPQLTAAAFALKSKGDITEALQVPRGWAVFYLKDIHEPRMPVLTDVEPRVRQALLAQKQQEAAVQKLKAERASGKTLDQIAAGLNLQVKESAELGPQGGMGLSPDLARAAMATDVGKMGDPLPDVQGAVLYEVKERKSWDPVQFAAAKEQTRSTLEQEKLGQLLASLVERRKRELGVEFDRNFLDRQGISADATGPAAQNG
ncbi:MAG TPA: SurA N-terminal domain-containing protein [Thermoanaerobaculia bacterium]